MFKKLRIFFLFLALWSSCLSAADEEHPVRVEMTAEGEAFHVGQPLWVAIHFEIDDSWHAYWKNPGDVGYPLSVDWDLPNGFIVSELSWPYPERAVTSVGVSYLYGGDLWLLAQVTPKEGMQIDEATISANVQCVVCSEEQCLSVKKTVSLTLPVSEGQGSQISRADFEAARSLLPTDRYEVRVKRDHGFIELTVPVNEEITSAYFCPDNKELIDETIDPVIRYDGETHILLKAMGSDQYPILQGTLVIQRGDSIEPILVSTPIDQEPSEIAMVDDVPLQSVDTSQFQGGIAMALLLAFVGGMILNLMPCVLPVISIKIFGFVKMAGQSRSQMLMHGVAFSIGVLLSFWVLAALLLSLQAYGHAVGWGFQLQEPIFVASLATVILVFGLSLFGVFELGTGFAAMAGQAEVKSKKTTELLGSFLSGILATTVATPCTGPFLGSAIGFAVTLPAIYALLIFTFLGLGMASPYLLISLFPSLIRFLPKPGPWMLTFKEILGFIMFATTLWLMWVFAAQTGTMALFILMAGFLSFAFGCWIYGKWGTPVRKKRTRRFAYAVALCFCFLGGYAVVISSAMEPEYSILAGEDLIAMKDENEKMRWEPYSEERMTELRSQGVPVLVDFTARWCLICQVNKVSLSTSEVEKKIQEKGVVRMLADWTRHDPAITRALAQYGRNGVPLYVLYGRDPSEPPMVLPQMLTPDIVLEYLDKIDHD